MFNVTVVNIRSRLNQWVYFIRISCHHFHSSPTPLLSSAAYSPRTPPHSSIASSRSEARFSLLSSAIVLITFSKNSLLSRQYSSESICTASGILLYSPSSRQLWMNVSAALSTFFPVSYSSRSSTIAVPYVLESIYEYILLFLELLTPMMVPAMIRITAAAIARMISRSFRSLFPFFRAFFSRSSCCARLSCFSICFFLSQTSCLRADLHALLKAHGCR